MRVLTVGVFDYFHYGHLKLFEQAKSYGDYLVVAVQDGRYILKYKPDAKMLYSTDQRIEIIGSLKMVDEVVVYTDVDQIVKNIDFDIFAVGEDQIHSGFVAAVEWCLQNNKRVVRLKRTEGIASSEIKNEISTQ